jgi:hypothetical protein
MTYLAFLKVCVFSSVFEIMDPTRAAVRGPIGGDCVKCPAIHMSAAERTRSSMLSEAAAVSTLWLGGSISIKRVVACLTSSSGIIATLTLPSGRVSYSTIPLTIRQSWVILI